MGDRKLVNEMPMISVIIPCFNVEQYVRRCVDSVLAQTIGQDNMEVILVDDCSTDHTPEILREYEADYPCVKTVFYEKNLRQGGARNRGMEVAQGKYLGFVDSDDWIASEMYEKLLSTLIQTTGWNRICSGICVKKRKSMTVTSSMC